MRSACASCARADSSIALRSATRLDSSDRSTLPSSWPAFTRLPSATFSDSSVPAALARTTAVPGATSGPENSTLNGIGPSRGCTTSLARNSRAAALSPLAAACVAGATLDAAPRDDISTAAATPATTSTPTPPISQRLRMDILSGLLRYWCGEV